MSGDPHEEPTKKKKKKPADGASTKKKKQKKPTVVVSAQPRRITLCYTSSGSSEEKRKVVLCPPTWDELLKTCSDLLGAKVGSIELPPEFGGGEIDSIDLIANGDILHVKSRADAGDQQQDQTKQKKKKKKKPSDPSSKRRATSSPALESGSPTTGDGLLAVASATYEVHRRASVGAIGAQRCANRIEHKTPIPSPSSGNDEDESEGFGEDEGSSGSADTNSLSSKTASGFDSIGGGGGSNSSNSSRGGSPPHSTGGGSSSSSFSSSPSSYSNGKSFPSSGLATTGNTKFQKLYHNVRSLRYRTTISLSPSSSSSSSSSGFTGTGQSGFSLHSALFSPDYVDLSSSSWDSASSRLPSLARHVIACGPVWMCGVFCADHEETVSEFVESLRDGVPVKEKNKATKKFLESIYSTKNPAADKLEQLYPFSEGTFIDINTGQNIVAAIQVPNESSIDEGYLQLMGAKNLHPICLGLDNPAKRNLAGATTLRLKSPALKIAIGPLHAACITVDNQLMTWGYNINCSLIGSKADEIRQKMGQGAGARFEISGQLGSTKSGVYYSKPEAVKRIEGAILDVSAGGAHTVSLTSAGVWSWGCNDEGQLGNQDDHLVPHLIPGLQSKAIASVVCGAHHTVALTSEGELYAWGYNDKKQLGLRTNQRCVFEPTLVDALKGKMIARVSSGDTHTAAITDNGQLYTWGGNEFFQLGRPSSKKYDGTPTLVSLKRMFAIDVNCGAVNTAIISAEGLVLVCGKLAGPGMCSHQQTFRLLEDVLQKNIYVAKVACGMTHYAFLQDKQFTDTLDLLIRACSFKSFTKDEMKRAIDSTPPFFFQKLQYRALKSVARANEGTTFPSLEAQQCCLEFSKDCTVNRLQIRNTSKKEKLSVVPQISMIELPADCTLEFDPPDLCIRPGKTGEFLVKLNGRPSANLCSYFGVVAQVDKGRDPLQYFVLLAINAFSGTSQSMVEYAKERLAALQKTEEKVSVTGGGGKKKELESAGSERSQASASGKLDVSSIDFANADVVLYEKLGSGGSGAVVYRCTANGFTCAVKVLDVDMHVKDVVDSFLREIEIIENLNHPRIIKYLGHDVTLNKLRLFMEFYPFSLGTILRKRRGRLLPSREVLKICTQICEGMLYLHSQHPPIIHRDLKPGNVLVALDEQDLVKAVKITDFDVSRTLAASQQAITMAGTPQYAAPEVVSINKVGYTIKADVWSFGMLVFEVLTLKTPFAGEELRLVPTLIEQGTMPELPREHAESLRQNSGPMLTIMAECLRRNPAERPTAAQILHKLEKIRL